ncbi:MAG: hypothetical protein U1E76_19975 [Planctomycetota bacterium]
MMTCERVLSLLPLYSGGDLESEQQNQVSAHLGHCLSCYREQRRYADAMEAMACVRADRSLPVALDHLAESVLDRVHAEQTTALPWIERRWWRWPTVLPYAAAAALLMLVAGTSLLSSGDGNGRSPTAIGAPHDQLVPPSDSGAPVIFGTPASYGRPRRIFDFRRIPNPPAHRDM